MNRSKYLAGDQKGPTVNIRKALIISGTVILVTYWLFILGRNNFYGLLLLTVLTETTVFKFFCILSVPTHLYYIYGHLLQTAAKTNDWYVTLTDLKVNRRALEYKLHRVRHLFFFLFSFLFFVIEVKHLEESLHFIGA